MKGGSGLKITLVIILLAALIALSIKPISERISLGLDLQGGAQVVLQAHPEEGEVLNDEVLEQTIAVMRNRVDQFGVSEPVIQKSGNDRIIVELAGIDNPDEAIELLGTTAKMQFVGPDGVVIMDGSHLKDAQPIINNQTNEPQISLEFDSEGTKLFAEATAKFYKQQIAIYLDEVLIQNPLVNAVITDGKAVIEGGFYDENGNLSFEAAANSAALLRGGALPVELSILSKSTVGPSLGSDSLDKSIKAIFIGALLLIILMIGYYRLPGTVAIFSLILYALLLLWGLALFNATLTLAGIAGFALSVGIAVDSNIIIYERIKEDLRTGKSLRAGIDSGFKRAFMTILDANITTMIAALVLFKFGSGSVQGFALTLAIGLVASMFTAITFTHYILKWTAETNSLSHSKYYGV